MDVEESEVVLMNDRDCSSRAYPGSVASVGCTCARAVRWESVIEFSFSFGHWYEREGMI